MTVLACLLMFLGFLFAYYTSNKIKVEGDNAMHLWLSQQKKIAKGIAIVLMTLSFMLLIYRYGWGAGILSGFVILMTWGSLIILFSPLRLLSVKGLISIAFIFIILELFVK